MTWYANYILAEPKQTIIRKLCAVPAISNGLYLVKDLDDYLWFDERVRHGLPPGGLLVGREICDLGSHAEQWHGDEAISWKVFIGPENIEVIQPEIIISFEEDDVQKSYLEETLPPIEFLRFLKWVSITTGSVVSFYYCFTWGGDTEEEFAWVFSDEDKVYRFRNYETTFEFQKAGSREIREGAVLNLTLRHHKLDLPSGYFALCSRSFKWSRYRIKCE
jgi:hypothetical protein